VAFLSSCATLQPQPIQLLAQLRCRVCLLLPQALQLLQLAASLDGRRLQLPGGSNAGAA
jgi:hypothetical protein